MKKLTLALTILSILCSCEKLFFEENYDSSDPYESFDYLWQQVDERYSFFEVKDINWEEVGERHRAMIYPEIDDDSLFRVMGSMLTELKDDHSNLSSSFNVSFFGLRYQKNDNYESTIVVKNYIGTDFYISGPFRHDFIDHNLVPSVGREQIAYIRFGSFTGTTSDVNMNFILDRYRDTDGLIFDLRENGGGAVSDVFRILSKFIEEETTVYYSRIRNGSDHDDFSELEPAVASPSSFNYVDKPVIFLCDRGTYSAGSFTSLSTKAIDNITLMGDTTGGGLGLPNGGQLPNGWNYRFSVTQALTKEQAEKIKSNDQALIDEVNAENYENGVPPDIYVTLDWTNLNTDEILERAIQEILNDPRN
ncbi:S41 family peptidase [Reichenbachiella ulvae]|uniref:S41 family peptidase n=1 Tax=Reichenbachiella ulvae TaxID=2980104 RepID=A0ABT3CPK6_9BACT|nr:S41 family peptidase [Reichenbachiella ulvae]MCV9385547.1 S41 family peptidase [Reichenbachiella ulvae]